MAALSWQGRPQKQGLFNRVGSDGAIIQLYKAGSTVGSIGSEGGNSVYIANDDAGLRFSGASNCIVPCGVAGASSDGLLDLGLSGLRFKDLYITGLDVTYSTYNKISSYFSGSYISGFKFSDLNGGIWYDAASDDLTVSASHANSQLILESGGSESARIDSSGNLLVGKTTTNIATSGCRLGSFGAILTRGDGAEPLRVNRTGSDGDIIKLDKDGTAVGSIGTTGGNLQFMSGSVGVGVGDDNLYPTNGAGGSTDSALDIGDSAARFRNIYRSGSTYSTSDRSMKQDIRELTGAERNVAVACKGLLKAFRFIDNVEKDGDNANIHFGVIAQELAEAFEAEGLDANHYQVYKSATYTDENDVEQTRLNVCYENLLAFIIAAI